MRYVLIIFTPPPFLPPGCPHNSPHPLNILCPTPILPRESNWCCLNPLGFGSAVEHGSPTRVHALKQTCSPSPGSCHCTMASKSLDRGWGTSRLPSAFTGILSSATLLFNYVHSFEVIKTRIIYI